MPFLVFIAPNYLTVIQRILKQQDLVEESLFSCSGQGRQNHATVGIVRRHGPEKSNSIVSYPKICRFQKLKKTVAKIQKLRNACPCRNCGLLLRDRVRRGRRLEALQNIGKHLNQLIFLLKIRCINLDFSKIKLACFTASKKRALLKQKNHTWKEQSLTLSAQCGLFLVGITKIVDAGSFTCLHCIAQQRGKNTKIL